MTLLRTVARAGAAAALAAAILSWAAPARSQGYPRLGLVSQVLGTGYPLWDSTGAFNTQVLDQIARYDEVVMDASPITEYRPDAIAQLRQRHPGIRLLAYVTGHFIWPASAPDSTVHYPTRYWDMIRNMDGFLYNRSGNQYGLIGNAFANVNIAKRDANGNFVVAEAIAGLFYDAIVSKNLWDGLFVDTFCSTISWSQVPGDSIDFVRAGYPSIQALDVAWSAATDTLASRLRQLSGGTVILVGNCNPGNKYAWFNGWMAENFPYLNGGTWHENMYRNPGGYFAGDQGYRPPPSNYLNSAASDPSHPYAADNMRKVRFGLGSAALGEGYGVFGYRARVVSTYPYFSWWYDEYAVDRASGRSTTLLENTGWLGPALGPYSQRIWISSAPDAVANPGFETDLSGWTFRSTYPGSFTRDPSTAAVGTASARVHVSQVEVYPWGAGIQCSNPLAMMGGVDYSATFWAKASAPRRVPVAAGLPTGGGLAESYVDMTTTWQQFQVVLHPTASGTTYLQFFLGSDVGDVWFDDVHYQSGTSSIYRRDFKYGTVLVNPSNANLEVPLERSFYRIRGLQDPVTNDGTSGRQFVVPANDALFLLGADQVKPAAVLDLHVVH